MARARSYLADLPPLPTIPRGPCISLKRRLTFGHAASRVFVRFFNRLSFDYPNDEDAQARSRDMLRWWRTVAQASGQYRGDLNDHVGRFFVANSLIHARLPAQSLTATLMTKLGTGSCEHPTDNIPLKKSRGCHFTFAT